VLGCWRDLLTARGVGLSSTSTQSIEYRVRSRDPALGVWRTLMGCASVMEADAD